ncbi:M67 family metallopeptidase [Crocosphaera sp. Alani8]|uniref:M67 family metallopeptidase n=1 Tax=Crocosphaera sp. Alani8 TaxID=3038952 RepID=UPI00313CFDD4
MIYFSNSQLQQIENHAERTYPEECCGLLLGIFEASYQRVIEVRETDNDWTPTMSEDLDNLGSSGNQPLSKKNRFSIAPSVLLQVQKEMRDRELNIIGIYHSHPDHPAIPSEFDREIAWSDYSYVIASLRQGKVSEIKSWTLKENRQFKPEKIKIIY